MFVDLAGSTTISGNSMSRASASATSVAVKRTTEPTEDIVRGTPARLSGHGKRCRVPELYGRLRGAFSEREVGRRGRCSNPCKIDVRLVLALRVNAARIGPKNRYRSAATRDGLIFPD